MKLTLAVSIYDDFCNNFQYAVVTITPEDINRIKKLAAAVKELGVYKVSEFDYSCEMMAVDPEADSPDGLEVLQEPEEPRIEAPMLNVKEDEFLWSGYIKHANTRWETSTVKIADLESGEDIDEREAA